MLPEKFMRHQPRVRELREQGVSYRRIKEELGISTTTAWRLASDEHEARYQEANRQSCERRAVTA